MFSVLVRSRALLIVEDVPVVRTDDLPGSACLPYARHSYLPPNQTTRHRTPELRRSVSKQSLTLILGQYHIIVFGTLLQLETDELLESSSRSFSHMHVNCPSPSRHKTPAPADPQLYVERHPPRWPRIWLPASIAAGDSIQVPSRLCAHRRAGGWFHLHPQRSCAPALISSNTHQGVSLGKLD
jgi:hypothetical protein